MKAESVRVFTDWRYFLAFGFGSGLSPVAPGTVGSLAAVALYFALQMLGVVGYGLVVVAVLVGGIFICDQVSRDMQARDPSSIVLDEFVGLWVALFYLPSGWYWIPIGFGLFRVFDIAKPWPVGWMDKRLKGGMGIMLDDVAAGVYALGVVQLSAFVVSRVTG